MKNILITGENSYIGNSVGTWINRNSEDYKIVKLSVRDDSWKIIDFSDFDVIVHTAAMVHVKESRKNKTDFFAINRDLTNELAKKAKAQGVRHFIFLSSIAVYGINKGFITKETIPRSSTAYGMSKLEGEALLRDLQDDIFKVSIIRSPLVYGKGCKGNYVKLSRIARLLPFFPKMDNLRSMIYIDNLTEFIKQLIENQEVNDKKGIDAEGGIYFPQNREYVNIGDLVNTIALANGRKVGTTQAFNAVAKMIKLPIIEKLFFDLQYDMAMSQHKFDYRLVDFEKSIKRTEGVVKNKGI